MGIHQNLPSQSLVGHVPDVPGENNQDEVAGVSLFCVQKISLIV
jgi:hypothetical protein